MGKGIQMKGLIAACAGAAMTLTLSTGPTMASPRAGDTGNSGAAARAPYCGNRWGSGAKEAGTMAGSPVSAVRAGVHGCFDRLGYGVRYVSKIIQDASGKVIAVRERRVEAEETKY